MSRFHSVALATVLLATLIASPRELRAQFPSTLAPGTRVRVWLPEASQQSEGPARRQLLRGTIESTSGDTLRITIPRAIGTLEVPRSSVRRIDVSQGVSRPASAFERAAGGAIGGAITNALMNDPKRTGGPHYRTDWRAAGVGAVWGAGIGAVVGFAFPHERWHRVRLGR
jgi:hypothetical protein